MDFRSIPRTETISGFFFVATTEEVSAMDMLAGPTRPMTLGKKDGRRVLIRDAVIPHRYHIWFLDVLISAVSPSTHGLSAELIRDAGPAALYRIPRQVTDVLSQFTPDRVDFVMSEVSSITSRVWSVPEVPKYYKEGGVSSAVLMVRGDALKATPRASGKEVYYWCYRTADANKLRDLQT